MRNRKACPMLRDVAREGHSQVDGWDSYTFIPPQLLHAHPHLLRNLLQETIITRLPQKQIPNKLRGSLRGDLYEKMSKTRPQIDAGCSHQTNKSHFWNRFLEPNQRHIEPDHYCLHSVQRYSNLITPNAASYLLLAYPIYNFLNQKFLKFCI